MTLILASASPRRRDLLAQACLRFDVLPAHIDEALYVDETPTAYVQRLALQKAQAIHKLHPKAVVLGADTTVVCEQQILNKPEDRADAERMLRQLSGRVHEVHTGIAVVTPSLQRSQVETTSVSFSNIPADELAQYLATGDSLDKAGAYGIQGYAARWIPRIEGDFFNVMGLPVSAVIRLLRETGALDLNH